MLFHHRQCAFSQKHPVMAQWPHSPYATARLFMACYCSLKGLAPDLSLHLQ